MTTALIIDDERDICELIEMGLMGQDVHCTSVYNIKAGIKLLKENQYDIIFCDIRLPDGDGLDLLAHVKKHYPDTPICMITAHGNMDMAIRALKLGAFDFINKPFELKQLRAVCRAALKSTSDGEINPDKKSNNTDDAVGEAGHNRHPRQTELIGNAPVMEKVRQMIVKVAHSQAPVFIHGESGTGKEVTARSIHEQSRRANGPFIAVNCGAIPENLVESEFFGYKKGAFTGANQDTDGLFVAANGGTLFLDEVADLPLAMQVKLLRAIQERAIRPIGGDKEEFVDVRIISATHHDLAAKVKEGEFREDLYYRLNVIGLTMPPLRDREGDIAVLSEFLLNKLAKNAHYPKAKLSPAALAKLQSYHFPGNVRELENVLERALTFMDGESIQADDIHINISGLHDAKLAPISIPEEAKVAEGLQSTPSDNVVNDFDFSLSDDPKDIPTDLEQYMEDMERQLLLKALEESGHNKTKAAEALGISFRAMRYKLKKLGID